MNAVVSGERAVEQAEAFALRPHLADHGHDRRDADAAGDEQEILRARRQPEIVDRRGHHQFVAGLHVVDEVGGAAAAIGLALDRDQIAIALGRVVAQRIFAQQAVRHPDRDMRAGGKFRQWLAARVAEFQQMDAVGDLVVARHAQRHRYR